MTYDSSAARRLDLYPDYVPTKRPAPKQPVRLKVVDHKAAKNSPSLTFSSFLIFAFVIACVCFILHNQVKINELNREIYRTNQEITNLESEQVKMQSSLENTLSVKNIAKQAEQELGMQRVNPNQVIDLRVYEEDRVEISQKGSPEDFSEAVESVAANIAGFFKGFFFKPEN